MLLVAKIKEVELCTLSSVLWLWSYNFILLSRLEQFIYGLMSILLCESVQLKTSSILLQMPPLSTQGLLEKPQKHFQRQKHFFLQQTEAMLTIRMSLTLTLKRRWRILLALPSKTHYIYLLHVLLKLVMNKALGKTRLLWRTQVKRPFSFSV